MRKKKYSEKCLFAFEHYPLVKALKETSEGLKAQYLVTTINGTFANNRESDIDYDPKKPSPNYNEVHKNQYVMTIEQIFDFQSKLYEVSEEIIKIEPMVYSKSKPLKNIVSEIEKINKKKPINELKKRGAMLNKAKTTKLDYEKIGSNFAVSVYENFGTNKRSKLANTKMVMNEQQLVNYMYAEGYIDNKPTNKNK